MPRWTACARRGSCSARSSSLTASETAGMGERERGVLFTMFVICHLRKGALGKIKPHDMT